jgi:hypothetical protein
MRFSAPVTGVAGEVKVVKVTASGVDEVEARSPTAMK